MRVYEIDPQLVPGRVPNGQLGRFSRPAGCGPHSPRHRRYSSTLSMPYDRIAPAVSEFAERGDHWKMVSHGCRHDRLATGECVGIGQDDDAPAARRLREYPRWRVRCQHRCGQARIPRKPANAESGGIRVLHEGPAHSPRYRD